MSDPAPQFAGAVPDVYDDRLVPLIFDPYAADLAARTLAVLGDTAEGRTVVETAAGTGAATRALDRALPPAVRIVATDLSPAMLATARRKGGSTRVEWQTADALSLPFGPGSADAVVCQFGVMFFPDRVAGYAEARRILAGGGRFLFNAWDRIGANPFAATVHDTLQTFFPDDPPQFFATGPHGYHDAARIRADLDAAGFREVVVETVEKAARAATARDVAIAYCQGTPLRPFVEARGPEALAGATDAVEKAIARRFGPGPVEAPISALVVTAA